MTIAECIAALVAIQAEYGGDLPVLHHDDWDDFLVEDVRVEPARDGTDPMENCVHPAHVVLSGDAKRFQCEDGSLK